VSRYTEEPLLSKTNHRLWTIDEDNPI